MKSILHISICHAVALRFGVNYGQNGDNLPSAEDVIGLYKKCEIKMIRLFEPISEILEALKGTEIKVSLGVKNEDLQTLASSTEAASSWVSTTFAPIKDLKIYWITLGNEAIPGPDASYIPDAMSNVNQALTDQGFCGINITTVISGTTLQTSYPPSSGAFTDEASEIMSKVVEFLKRTSSPLMVNVYPYFAYASNPKDISLAYALSNATEPVIDGDFKYYALIDAMIDSYIAALEKVGGGDVGIIISETGWPTAGNEPYTSVENARAYLQSLSRHLWDHGTPRRPDADFLMFLFEMFDEDQKPAAVEQNFGMFEPTTMRPKFLYWQTCYPAIL